MNKHIKRLQKLLADGKITVAEYKEQLQELLDDEIIKQEEYDEAEGFEVEDPDDKPIYSQADFDRGIIGKARQLIKKELKAAGVDLDGVSNKDLLSTFASLALTGQKKGNLSVDEKELNDLQKKAKAYDDLQPKVKTLTIENAVLKAAGKYKPLNPKQVVRALDDYSEHLEYDEDDNLVSKSVDRALKKLAEAEPNLFTESEQSGDQGGGDPGTQGGFKGKSPGGSGTGGAPEEKKHEKLKNEALAMLNLTKNQ